MKRKAFFRLITAFLLFAPTVNLVAAPKTMNVQYKKGEIHETPSYLGNITGEVSLGDKLTILESKGAWMKVSSEDGKISGWIHSVYLTAKKIKMDAGAGDANVKASSGEQTLATKGFNSQVETSFKEKHKDANFTCVDKMEAVKVSTKEIKEFLEKGQVKPPDGGAQ